MNKQYKTSTKRISGCFWVKHLETTSVVATLSIATNNKNYYFCKYIN